MNASELIAELIGKYVIIRPDEDFSRAEKVAETYGWDRMSVKDLTSLTWSLLHYWIMRRLDAELELGKASAARD